MPKTSAAQSKKLPAKKKPAKPPTKAKPAAKKKAAKPAKPKKPLPKPAPKPTKPASQAASPKTAPAPKTTPAPKAAAPKAAAPKAAKPTPAPKATPSAPRISYTDDLGAVLSNVGHPKDAAGVSRAKGLGKSAGIDAFLGMGFPHMIVTTDEPLVPTADREAFTKRYPRADAVMPRAAVDLHYTIAGLAADGNVDPALPKPKKPVLQKAVSEALRYRTGWTAQELEVMYGTLPVLEEIVTQLTSAPPAEWRNFDRGASAIILAALPWMLWRVPTADRDRFVTALRTKLEGQRAGAMYPAAKVLDVVLSGRAGIERSGRTLTGEIHLGKLVFAHDDPDWIYTSAVAIIEKLRPQDREQFDPQLVVACPKLLPVFRASVDKFLADQRPRMQARLALFR